MHTRCSRVSCHIPSASCSLSSAISLTLRGGCVNGGWQGVRVQLRRCLIRPGVCVPVWCDMSQGAGGANERCFSRNLFNPHRHGRCGGEGSLYQCAPVERVLQNVLACVCVESSGFGMVCWRLNRPRLSAPRLHLKPLSASRPNVSSSSLILTIDNFEIRIIYCFGFSREHVRY